MITETTSKPALSEEDRKKLIHDRMKKNQWLAWWVAHGAINPKEAGTTGAVGANANGQLLKPNTLQKTLQKVIVWFKVKNLPIRIRLLKSRQGGSSTGCAGLFYHHHANSPAGNDGLLLTADDEGKASMLRMFSTLAKYDNFFTENKAEVTAEKVVFSNGNTIRCGSIGGVAKGVGSTLSSLWSTETALYDSPSDANVSDAKERLMNTCIAVPTQPGTIIVEETTARGASGAFWERFYEAEPWEDVQKNDCFSDGKSVISLFFPFWEFPYPTTEAPLMTDQQQTDYLENMRSDEIEYWEKVKRETGHKLTGRDMVWRKYILREKCGGDEVKYDRDYPYSAQAAFSKSGSPRFSQKSTSILRQRMKLHTIPVIGNFTTQGADPFSKTEPVTFQRETREYDALWWIYEEPIVGCKYIVVVDPCVGKINTGAKDPDNHGIQVWRAGYRDEHGRWHAYKMVAHCIQSDGRKPFCRLEPYLAEREIWKASKYYGGTNQSKIVIELPIDAGMTRSLAEKGANLYVQTKRNAVEETESRDYGFVQTAITRPAIIADVAKRLNENFQAEDGTTIDGGGIDVVDEWTIWELENFVQKPNGTCSAASGHHDDQVMCLAIACGVEQAATPYSPPTRKLDRFELEDMRAAMGQIGRKTGTW